MAKSLGIASFGAFSATAAACILVWLRAPVPTAGLLFLSLAAIVTVVSARLLLLARSKAVRVSLGIGLVLAVVPAAVVLGALSAFVVNNLRLGQFERQIQSLPLPPNSSVALIRSQVGVLTGNGNHCDFSVELELSAPQSLAELQSHYQSVVLVPAIPGGAGGGLPALEVSPSAHGEDSTYVVAAIDAPYEGIFDVRCH